MTLTFGSLFAGIGGLDLGLERAGLKCQWQVENDPYCIRVLTKHWPDIPRYGDVRELSGSTLEAVDVICGGFPCQPISRAGRRSAQGDSRWLWPEFARLVDEVRPRYVIVENVPPITKHGGAGVIADLASLGFDAKWSLIPATTVGAPHLRERFFLVAYTSGRRYQPQKEPLCAGWQGSEFHSWWTTEPGMGRVAHGIPSQMDRLRVLGNAVVPQVAEVIGRWLVKLDEQTTS